MIRHDLDNDKVTLHMSGSPAVIIYRPLGTTADEWRAYWGDAKYPRIGGTAFTKYDAEQNSKRRIESQIKR